MPPCHLSGIQDASPSGGTSVSLNGTRVGLTVASSALDGSVVSTALADDSTSLLIQDSIVYGDIDTSASGFRTFQLHRSYAQGNISPGATSSTQVAGHVKDNGLSGTLDLTGIVGGDFVVDGNEGTCTIQLGGCENTSVVNNMGAGFLGKFGGTFGSFMRGNEIQPVGDLAVAPWVGGPTTPAVPASTTQIYNSTGFDCAVYITANVGGDTAVMLGGTGVVTVTAADDHHPLGPRPVT